MDKPIERYLAEMGGDLLLQVASQSRRADELAEANSKLYTALCHAQELLNKSAAEIIDLNKVITELKGSSGIPKT